MRQRHDGQNAEDSTEIMLHYVLMLSIGLLAGAAREGLTDYVDVFIGTEVYDPNEGGGIISLKSLMPDIIDGRRDKSKGSVNSCWLAAHTGQYRRNVM